MSTTHHATKLPDLTGLLTLERLDVNLFRSQAHRENRNKDLFGGQVLGQALCAATMTLSEGESHYERLAHSCHAYFLHPGSSSTPVIYDVDVLRKGNNFSNVRVLARQMGRTIFSMAVSFHKKEPGFEHQSNFDVSSVPPPESLITLPAYIRQNNPKHQFPDDPYIEFKPVNPEVFTEKSVAEPEAYYWFRALSPLPDSAHIQRAALAFASDMGLMLTCMRPHSVGMDEIMGASLDHAIWFHSDVQCNEWLLYKTDSPWAGEGRGINRGLIYDLQGKLIASTAQEGLVRLINNRGN